MEYKKLIEAARQAQLNAYAPYSRFQVGAALLAKNGSIYRGCNVENSSFGATNCAERTAIFSAVADGQREFLAIAVVSSGGTATYPCGICRQVLMEFAPNITVVLPSNDGKILVHMISELLPHSFSL